MASIRKRGNSYLIVVSMGYDYEGNRIKAQQKTVKPPEDLSAKQTEKWLDEQAMIFERAVKTSRNRLTKASPLPSTLKFGCGNMKPSAENIWRFMKAGN